MERHMQSLPFSVCRGRSKARPVRLTTQGLRWQIERQIMCAALSRLSDCVSAGPLAIWECLSFYPQFGLKIHPLTALKTSRKGSLWKANFFHVRPLQRWPTTATLQSSSHSTAHNPHGLNICPLQVETLCVRRGQHMLSRYLYIC